MKPTASIYTYEVEKFLGIIIYKKSSFINREKSTPDTFTTKEYPEVVGKSIEEIREFISNLSGMLIGVPLRGDSVGDLGGGIYTRFYDYRGSNCRGLRINPNLVVSLGVF